MMMTRQTGGKTSGTGSAAGAATAVCALTRGRARKTAARGPAPTRRPAGEPRGYGGPDRGYEPAGFDQPRGYEPSPRGYGERAPRSRDDQRTERIPAARRGGSYQDAPEPATPVGARAPRAATGAPRRRRNDTGPATRSTNRPLRCGPHGHAVSADPDLADSDVFPRVRAEIPETEAKPRAKNQAKGRGRTSRGRHDDDDDDWPSTEWDKLSDEQYWAELSADKPLATTARSAQPSTAAPAATPAKPARAAAPPPASGYAASRPQPALDAEPPEGQGPPPAARPSRLGRASVRARPGGQMARSTDPGRLSSAERLAAAATERLPPVAGLLATGRRRRRTCPQRPSRSRTGNDDPLTSPHFARGAGGADDSRSYRTPRRNPGPRQDRSGGQAYPGTPTATPARLRRTPLVTRPRPAATQTPGAERHRPGHQPGRARPRQRARARPGQLRLQTRDSLAGVDNGDRRYTDSSGGYESYPGGARGQPGLPRVQRQARLPGWPG